MCISRKWNHESLFAYIYWFPSLGHFRLLSLSPFSCLSCVCTYYTWENRRKVNGKKKKNHLAGCPFMLARAAFILELETRTTWTKRNTFKQYGFAYLNNQQHTNKKITFNFVETVTMLNLINKLYFARAFHWYVLVERRTMKMDVIAT